MLLGVAAVLYASTANAASLPHAVFPQARVESVIGKIMAACIARGFLIGEHDAAMVTCQAGQIPNRRDGGFRPDKVTSDSQTCYFRFSARQDGEDVAVEERSRFVSSGLTHMELDANGRAYFRFNAQVRDFLAELGGAVAE
jgi:hypothetical protein